MRRAALAITAAFGACAPAAGRAIAPLEAPSAPVPGLTIAIYAPTGGALDGATVVDDRRWVDLPLDHLLVLDRIDPEAPLDTLTISSLTAGDRFAVGACTRGGGATLRCAIDAAPGRRLVGIHYEAHAIAYRAEHRIAVGADDRATVASAFAITTPSWHARAQLTIYDRRPGGARPATAIATRAIVLDGQPQTIAATERTARARLRWAFSDGDVTSPTANDTASPPVRVWLVLDDVELAPGTIAVHLARTGEPPRDFVVLDADREQLGLPRPQLRLPLWIDPDVHVARIRTSDFDNDSDGDRQAEHDTFVVTNTGTVARELWIEKQLRDGRRHIIKQGWPSAPAVRDDRVYSKVTVSPGAPQRLGYTIVYE